MNNSFFSVCFFLFFLFRGSAPLTTEQDEEEEEEDEGEGSVFFRVEELVFNTKGTKGKTRRATEGG